jgi:hypothetical protein
MRFLWMLLSVCYKVELHQELIHPKRGRLAPLCKPIVWVLSGWVGTQYGR